MNNWKRLKVRDFATTQSGGTPSTTRSDYWDGDVPWINSGELKDCSIKKASKYITKLGLDNSSARLFPKNTVVIALTGATTAKLGILDIETSTNQSVTGILPNNEFNSKFLFYQLFSLRQEILSSSLGTAQPHINKRIVDDILVRLPSVKEQQSIVSKIEELLSDLENGKQQLLLAQQQLKVYRQSLLKWAFEGRFGYAQRPLHDVKDGELPKGWKLASLGEICSPKRKCSYGVLVPGDHVENGILLLRVGDIDDCGRIDQTKMKKISPTIANKFKRTFLEGGEVVMSLVGAIGRTAVVPATLKGANIARAVGVIPVSKNISAKFVELMLRSPLKIKEHNDRSHEVARKTLNLEDVIKSKIPLPSYLEQLNIVNELESKLTVCDKIEETISQSLQQAETLRQSILKKAFEGKLLTRNE